MLAAASRSQSGPAIWKAQRTMTPRNSIRTGRSQTTINRRTLMKAAPGLAAPVLLRQQVAGQESASVPAGMALVSSPRLPLHGIGSEEAGGVLAGTTTQWEDAGSPVALPVEVLAIEGQAPEGAPVLETFPGYGELAAALANRPGTVALAPVDQVDFRANVIAV